MKARIYDTLQGVRRAALVSLLLLQAMGSWALTQWHGVYQIGSKQDLIEFGNIAATNVSAKGRLTADIDMYGTNWEPIGGRGGSNPFQGYFDGAGHRIRNLVADNAVDGRTWSNQGLFGWVGDGCTIVNVILDRTCHISGDTYVGGIVGLITGDNAQVLIANCGFEGTVQACVNSSSSSSGQNAGGIVGCNHESSAKVTIANCYNSGQVIAGWEAGAISGWIGSGTVKNCYNVGTVEETKDGYTGNHHFIRSGNLTNCYDLQPVSHCTDTYDGLTKVQSRDDISGKLGEFFHGLAIAFPETVSGCWQISSVDDYRWFAAFINNFSDGTTFHEARLAAPLDMANGTLATVPIGTYSHPFYGRFDGQFYPVTRLSHPFFGVTKNVEITRVTIESGEVKPVSSSDYKTYVSDAFPQVYYTGCLIGCSLADDVNSTMITYCYSRADITDTTNGACDLGGLVGKLEGTMKYCFYAGKATYHNNNSWAAGGLVGSCNNPGNLTYVTQCYVNATLDFQISDANKDYRGKFVGSNATGMVVEYCVINRDCGNMASQGWVGTGPGCVSGGDDVRHVDNITDWTYGNACWCLNRDSDVNPVWFQNKPGDPVPVWDKSHAIVHQENGGYSRAPVRNGMPSLKDGDNRAYLRIILPDGTRKYVDSSFRPSDSPSQLILSLEGTNVYLASQTFGDRYTSKNYMSYHLDGCLVRRQNGDSYAYYYRSSSYDGATEYTAPRMQYYMGKDCSALASVNGVDMRSDFRSPYLSADASEQNLSWADGKTTWTEDASRGIVGSAYQTASRRCIMDVDEEGYLVFILRDLSLQDESRPMRLNSYRDTDDSPFAGKGNSWSTRLYVIADTDKSGQPYLRVATSAEKAQAVKVEVMTMTDEVEFVPYVGDVYSGKNTWLGSEVPDNLKNTGAGASNWKTSVDDPRLDASVRMQRAHEYERDVWVFPGITKDLYPFSDFHSTNAYYVKYLRWYDYRTGQKSDVISFPDYQPLQGASGHFGGEFLTNEYYNAARARVSYASNSSAAILGVVAMDASSNVSDDMATYDEATSKFVVHEPTLTFRHIFNIRNARLRADQMTASVTDNNNYIDAHRIKIITRRDVPFQYRLDCPEDTRWDDEATPTDYWYQTAGGGYKQVYHYIVETKFNGTVQGQTVNLEGSINGLKPGLAYTYKSGKNQNPVIYMLQPQVGTYTITLYAADKYKNGDAGVPICIKGTSTPIKLMEYTLEVLDTHDASMVNEEDFFADQNKSLYQHQWPSEMRRYYGLPKVEVNFDDINESHCAAGADGGLFYKWPRRWEESSYGFGYDKRYDYNMYVVANDARAVPYHEGVNLLEQNSSYKYYKYARYDRLYADTKGERKGFFYYTNAASDPGRMTILNVGTNFCTGTEVFVSAWIKEFSHTSETASVVFSFKGVAEDGTETTLSSFVSGYVTGGYNSLVGYREDYTETAANNPDDRGKWMHVYYCFKPEETQLGFDHYVISVENNCVSSGGADYGVDDIEAFVCTPAVQARQLKPVCNGDIGTPLLLTVDFDRLLKGFAFSEATTSAASKKESLAYCFLRKDVYNTVFDRELKKLSYDKDDPSEVNKARAKADAIAFEASLVKGAYGTDNTSDAQYRYGVLTLNTYYDGNPRYVDGNTRTYVERQALSMEPLNGVRTIVFPSSVKDTDLKVGSEYLVSIIHTSKTNPGAADFRFYDECSKLSEFLVVTSGEVKVDGQLQSKLDNISVCANEHPVVTIDLNGIGVDGEAHKIQNAYFDWYQGALDPVDGDDVCFRKASHGGVLLSDALAYFRTYYYTATEDDFRDAAKCPCTGSYTQKHRDCILHYLDAGKIQLYRNSFTMSTTEQYNKAFDSDTKFRVVAVPFDPEPKLGYTYCLEPFMVTMSLSDRKPGMKDGDGQGTISYPASLTDVPLRMGLSQLRKARMNDAGTPNSVRETTLTQYVAVPLRDISPVTPGVTSLLGKADDDFVYLTASDDPNVAAGLSGALKAETDASEGDVRIVGRVVDITADRSNKAANKCHIGFIKDFKFREGYSYTLKFYYTENYDGVTAGHQDVCPGDVSMTVKVVPEYMKWTGAVNSDWNNDGNWARVAKADLHVEGDSWKDFVTDGGTNDRLEGFVPADFTKVIIPADVDHLPELYDLHQASNLASVTFAGGSRAYDFIKSVSRQGYSAPTATSDINYHMTGENLSSGSIACRPWYDHTADQVHFLPNAEMLAQEHLTYQRAWVDVELGNGRWYTLSSPLTGVVAGDMYLPLASARQETELFAPITFDDAVNDRFSPAVYQRGWDKAKATVYEKDNSQREVVVKTSWSHVYNDVGEKYNAGSGFSIKVKASRDKVLFRLPKDDKAYTYYSQDKQDKGNVTQIVGSNEERSYRLYMPGETVEPIQTGTDGKYFLIGNPFMAHLDMARFFKENPQFEPKYWVMTAGGQSSAIMNTLTGGFVGSATGTVPPLQGFFVEKKEAARSVTPVFTAEMETLEGRHTASDTTGLLNRTFWVDSKQAQTRAVADNMLTITASDADGHPVAQAMVQLSGMAHEGYDSSEDVALLQDDDLFATTNVYTLAGDTRSIINTLPAIGRLPLGVTAGKDELTTLTFTGCADMEGLTLLNELTGETVPVREGTAYVVKGESAGQLFLVGNEVQMDARSHGITVMVAGHQVSVLSQPQHMKVALYSTDGVLLHTAEGDSGTVTLSVPKSGVYMLRAEGEQASASRKVVVR